MSTLRYNDVFGTASIGSITLATGGTTATFAAAPIFPTITAPDIAKITVEPDTPNEEIIYVTAYTAGATTATVTRNAEATQGGQNNSNAHAAVAWVHGPTAADFAGGGGSLVAFSAHASASTAVTDGAPFYDMPGLSITNVTAGTYLFTFAVFTTTGKSGEFRASLTDGSNTALWPSGSASCVSVTNTDSTLQLMGSGVLVVASTITVKLRAAASAAIGNYSVGDRHLTLIQIA